MTQLISLAEITKNCLFFDGVRYGCERAFNSIRYENANIISSHFRLIRGLSLDCMLAQEGEYPPFLENQGLINIHVIVIDRWLHIPILTATLNL